MAKKKSARKRTHVRGAPADIPKVSKAAWQEAAQPWELAHWTRMPAADPRRALAHYIPVSKSLMENFGFKMDQFADSVVLEVGCGPTARLCAMSFKTLHAIDPLGDELREYDPKAFEHIDVLWPQPVEERIEELVGRFDAVFSLNCLDHCYDLAKALDSIYAYLKPDGIAFLSFDVNKRRCVDPTHPIRMRHRAAHDMIKAAGFRVDRWARGNCVFSDSVYRDNWGGGTAYHWWLTK